MNSMRFGNLLVTISRLCVTYFQITGLGNLRLGLLHGFIFELALLLKKFQETYEYKRHTWYWQSPKLIIRKLIDN